MHKSTALLTLILFTMSCSAAPEDDDPVVLLEEGDNNTSPQRDMDAEDPDMTADEQDMGDDMAEEMPPQPNCDAWGLDGAELTAKRDTNNYVVTLQTPGEPHISALFQVPVEGGQAYHAFTGDTLQECEACMVIQTGCQNDMCDRTFLATSGGVELSELADAPQELKLRLHDVRAVEVSLDQDLNSSVVSGGQVFCTGASDELTGPLTIDHCGGWYDPVLSDVSCGPGPLTVSFDADGLGGSLDRVLSVTWDFGDGETARGAQVTHTYQVGEWRAEAEVIGYVDDVRVTVNTPQMIKVY